MDEVVPKGSGLCTQEKYILSDNQSTMKMESNSMKLAGDKSRHVNICYFFINNILEREGIELLHCPTERMVADFYTKPLQGSPFKKMRDSNGTSPIF